MRELRDSQGKVVGTGARKPLKLDLVSGVADLEAAFPALAE
jgi:hypothetical protein